MSFQKSCVWVEQRRHLHQVQDSSNALLAESSHQLVELCLFTDHAVGPEPALGQGKPAGGLVALEGGEFDVAEARRLVKLDEVLLVLGHGEKSANSSISKKLKQLPPIKFPANTCVSSKARNKIFQI